ncbi:hypothetical protein K505DRAFT_97074 [Melanomma pulvis-pyrius CBS 109.77]|uniref:Uncharacterized protein n=1 Tax=Melanomma pulvis-pyrius CBS 109.77 TaxID=1314802 RepID=A0A6A6WZV5_9PLEO|nr:hypothetical protein K505DRAFT_97074 [Melanomma pulvis-pyrius CBS 109.77]
MQRQQSEPARSLGASHTSFRPSPRSLDQFHERRQSRWRACSCADPRETSIAKLSSSLGRVWAWWLARLHPSRPLQPPPANHRLVACPFSSSFARLLLTSELTASVPAPSQHAL